MCVCPRPTIGFTISAGHTKGVSFHTVESDFYCPNGLDYYSFVKHDLNFTQINLQAYCITEKRRMSTCVGCGSQIQDQYILRVDPDLEWHAACLKCTDCHQFLDETCTCYVRDGKTYCKRDYLRLFGAKCAKCDTAFHKTDFVMRARTKIFHMHCFRCCMCSKQLSPGDEFALRDDELWCKADHQVNEKSSPDNLHSGVGDSTRKNLNIKDEDRGLQMAVAKFSRSATPGAWWSCAPLGSWEGGRVCGHVPPPRHFLKIESHFGGLWCIS
ncbi:Insulin protein enhancer protein ISL-1 [Nymphon striatum]|nr:Insulin protein enhancer protein ISL-1 [Nymphon striatum]